ncbi:MAG: quinolinate synthase [Chloroflexi bacterium RBG_16_56_11]|nr:MAG: quinolinate synthase [Chloroflexi bacterium RBG_16_56_11]
MGNNGEQPLEERISELKRAKNAVILAHNYQRAEVQDMADFVGDSLELSQKAAKTEASVIVFCGVHFMAETASILNPQKTVLLPDAGAGCPMANMITADQLRQKKAELPGATVVTYINSSAEVKAESDYCCTSANGVRVVQSIPAKEIIFVPDQYLGAFIAGKTGKEMVLWPGYCPTHMRILPEDIEARRKEHPQAKVVVHPECRPDVVALADEALSTSGMIRYAAREDVRELIVGTEVDILHRMNKENPGKVFIAASKKAVCPNMKKITLEKVLWSLETLTPEVKVPEEIRVRARRAVDRMLAIG